MAHDHHEDLSKHVKKYMWIGGWLIFFTFVTVGLSYVELPTHGLNLIVGMILAAFKASLVCLIFMHLNHERPLIYKVLLFTVVFVVAMFVLFYLSWGEGLNSHKLEGFPGTPIQTIKH